MHCLRRAVAGEEAMHEHSAIKREQRTARRVLRASRSPPAPRRLRTASTRGPGRRSSPRPVHARAGRTKLSAGHGRRPNGAPFIAN